MFLLCACLLLYAKKATRPTFTTFGKNVARDFGANPDHATLG